MGRSSFLSVVLSIQRDLGTSVPRCLYSWNFGNLIQEIIVTFCFEGDLSDLCTVSFGVQLCFFPVPFGVESFLELGETNKSTREDSPF